MIHMPFRYFISQHFLVKSGTNFTNTFGNGIKIVGEGSHVVDNVSVGPIGENISYNLTLLFVFVKVESHHLSPFSFILILCIVI